MRLLIVRFILVPEDEPIEREQVSQIKASSHSDDAHAEHSRPVDEKRLGFIKYLVETGQIHD